MHFISRFLRILFCSTAFLLPLTAYSKNLLEISLLVSSGSERQALKEVGSYVSSNPRDVNGQLILGIVHSRLGQHSEAARIFTKISDEYPRLPVAYNNLAVVYAKQGKFSIAKELLQVAIHNSPSYAVAYANLEKVYAVLAREVNLGTNHGGTVAPKIKDTPPEFGFDLLYADDQLKSDILKNLNPRVSVLPNMAKTKPEIPPFAELADSDQAEEVQDAIALWAQAWSSKEVNSYLSAYAENFDHTPLASRKAWEKARQKRILHRAKILVSIENLSITVSDDTAVANFLQKYVSGSVRDASSKELNLIKVNGRWLILREKQLGASP